MSNKLIFPILFGTIILGVISLFSVNFFFLSKETIQEIKHTRSVRNAQIKLDEYLSSNYPTLESIFSDDHSWTATLSAERKKTILVTGDIIPARSVNSGVVRRNNPLWPYEFVAPFITSLAPDLVFVDLETPLLKKCPETNEGMIFCGSDRNIEGLKAIGADIVSVANNHFGNHGEDGINETIELLKSAQMMPAGIGGPVYWEVKGTKFAFLAYNDIEKLNNGLNNAEESFISLQIQEAKKMADVILVMFHWGAEYKSQPDSRQIELAHFSIDQGADLVVSNHPHWIQPVEIYKEKLIMYAHGNFIFDQMWSEKTKQGVLGLYTFYDNNLIDVEFLPIYIKDFGQVQILNGVEKQRVLSELKNNSLIRAEHVYETKNGSDIFN